MGGVPLPRIIHSNSYPRGVGREKPDAARSPHVSPPQGYKRVSREHRGNARDEAGFKTHRPVRNRGRSPSPLAIIRHIYTSFRGPRRLFDHLPPCIPPPSARPRGEWPRRRRGLGPCLRVDPLRVEGLGNCTADLDRGVPGARVLGGGVGRSARAAATIPSVAAPFKSKNRRNTAPHLLLPHIEPWTGR